MLSVEESIEIVENATCTLGDLALKIVKDTRVGKPCDDDIKHAYNIAAFLQALEVDSTYNFIDNEVDNYYIYKTLRNLSIDLFTIPNAPGIGQQGGNPNISNDEEMFKPTLQPTVQSPVKLALSSTPEASETAEVEVGQDISLEIFADFSRGLIKNGTGTLNTNPLVGEVPPVVGNTGGYEFIDPTGTLTRQAAPVLNFASYSVVEGLNNFLITANYQEGTGTYIDSKGNPSTVLDGDRAAGNVSNVLTLLTGSRYGFWAIGANADPDPTNSNEVRDFLTKQSTGGVVEGGGDTLDFNKLGEYQFAIPAGYESVWIAIPDIPGSNVQVILVESFGADVFSDFTEISTINVEGANGFTPIAYKLYRQTLSVGGYIEDVTYKVIIS